MGDYTQARLVVHHVPEEQAQAVLDILNTYVDDHQMSIAWESPAGPLTEVPLREDLTFEQVPICFSIDAVNELSEAAPGIVVTAHTSPKYEYLGDLAQYAPGIGFWSCVCDDSGDAIYTAEEMYAARTMSDADFDRLVGKPWDEAIAAFYSPSTSTAVGEQQNQTGQEGN